MGADMGAEMTRRARTAAALGPACVVACALAATLLVGAPTTAVAAEPATSGPVGTAETRLSDQAEAGGLGTTATAYSPADGVFLTTWTAAERVDQTVGNVPGLKLTIRGRFVDSVTGQPVGGEFEVATAGEPGDASRDAVDPTVAWSPSADAFVVAWADDRVADAAGALDTTAWDVRARTLGIGDDGAVLPSAPYLVGAGEAPDLAVDDDGRAVVAATETVVGPGEATQTTRVTRLTAAGTATDGPPEVVAEDVLDEPTAAEPTVAVGGGVTVVAYSTPGPDGDPVVLVSSAGAAGGFSPPAPVATGTQASPDVVATGEAGFLLAWQDGGLVDAPVSGLQLDADGAATGAVRALTSQPGQALAPTLSYDPLTTQPLLGWVQRSGTDHQVRVARLAPYAGDAATDEARLSTLRAAPNTQPTVPAIAWSAGEVGTTLVTWSGEAQTLAPGESEAFGRLLAGPVGALEADLGVGLTAAPATPAAPVTGVDAGEDVTYTLTYASAPDSPGTVADVTLTLPVAGFVADLDAIVSTPPAGRTVTRTSAAPLRWTVDALAPGETGTLTVTGRLAADTPDATTVTRRATIDAPAYDETDETDNSASADVTVDNRPAVRSFVRTGPAATNGTATYELTFSEAVTGLDTGDLGLRTTGTASGTPSVVALTGSRYEVSYAVRGDGTLLPRVLADAAVRDASGKPLATGNLPLDADAATTVDRVAPQATLTAPAGPLAGPFTVTIEFDEVVTGLELDDVAVGNGTATAVTGTGRSYQLAVTPGAVGDVGITLFANAAYDAAGNGSAAASLLVDRTAPTLDLTAPPGPFTGAFTATATFSEPVTGLTLGDFSASGVTLSELAGSGASYTVLATPPDDSPDGPVSVSLPAGAAQDAAGNPSAASPVLERSVDRTAPVVTLSAADGPFAGPFEVTVSFSEPVTGLTAADLEVVDGAVRGEPVPGGADSWTVTIVPDADGDVGVSLVAGAVDDAAGNPNPASAVLVRRADLTAPTVTLAAADGPFAGPFPVTVEFSEAVTGLAVDDLVVDGGRASDLAGSGASYTVTVTADGDGDVVVSLPADAVADQAGNGNLGSEELTRTVDATAPTLSIVAAPDQPDPVVGPTVRLLVEADEPVTDLAAADLTVSGTTGADAAAVRRTGPASFAVDVTGMVDSGEVVVEIAEDAVRDGLGNGSAAAESPAVAWAATAPPVLALADRRSCTAADATWWLDLTGATAVDVATSDARLLGERAVSVVGNGAGRRVVISPVPGRSGVATVTLSVTNPGGVDRQSIRVVVGDAGDEELVGRGAVDVILGRGGDDVLRGGSGRDLLCGGPGADRMYGGGGADVLHGHAGADTLVGGPGNDVLVGGPGGDRLFGGTGRDRLVQDG